MDISVTLDFLYWTSAQRYIKLSSPRAEDIVGGFSLGYLLFMVLDAFLVVYKKYDIYSSTFFFISKRKNTQEEPYNYF